MHRIGPRCSNQWYLRGVLVFKFLEGSLLLADKGRKTMLRRGKINKEPDKNNRVSTKEMAFDKLNLGPIP